jgi:osmotically-inducible protein OsmY
MGNVRDGFDSLSVRESHRGAFFCNHSSQQTRTMLDTALYPGTRNSSVNAPASAADKIRGLERTSRAAKSDFDSVSIEAVGQALRATGYAALRDIQIEIERGVVVLWGRVPTYHQKQLAQVTAQRVDGVRGIANGIEVVSCR